MYTGGECTLRNFFTGECILEIVYWRMYTGEVYAGDCIMEDVEWRGFFEESILESVRWRSFILGNAC